MIGLEDRQFLAQDFGIAHAAGARLRLACEIAGIDVPHPAALAGARRPCSGRRQATGGAPAAWPCLEPRRAR